MTTMHVEIWSDIACPWCYVGKRRFEAALADFEHADEVTVEWRSFELDPTAPAERPGSHGEHLAEKYGTTLEEAEAMNQRMADAAAGDGLELRFDRTRSGTTFDAHRLVHLAKAHDRQDAMEERLFAAYLTQGELLSDHATLARLAGEVGLPADEVDALLSSDRFADAVRDDERTAASFNITAVPFFVVDRRVGAAGAQPPEEMARLLAEGWRQQPKLETVIGGDACGPGGC